MAFVFRAEKKEIISAKAAVPGPGNYSPPETFQVEVSKRPFHSTAEKETRAPKIEETPGPGAYNIAKGLLPPERAPNIFFVPANPNEEPDHSRATNAFRSKSTRFANKITNENPGPGKYNQQSDFGMKGMSLNLPQKSPNLEYVRGLVKGGKNAVPSIPSNVHSYGYTENDEHHLVLNRNPLLQVQQFVGPGYYETKLAPQGLKYKGPRWAKSGVKKGANFVSSTATTSLVGPGRYDPNQVGLPDYKSNPHPGFISTSTRSFDAHVKQKLGLGKYQSKTPFSTNSTLRGVSGMETDDDEEEEDDEYMKDATPGPGYYHNESMMSSFRIKTPGSDLSIISGSRSAGGPKNMKSIAFGGSIRFKDPSSTTNDIGPGEYELAKNKKKVDPKYAKAPFQSSNIRFDRDNLSSQPGPGTYDPPVNLVDSLQEKARNGYAGSFGVTDKRFKISKLLEDQPGPGTYTSDIDKIGKETSAASAFKKGTHNFNSATGRNVFNPKADIIAAPGSYDLNYYNIEKKLINDDDEGDLPKRYPFNTGQARFEKPKEKPIPENDDEDDDDDDEPTYGASRNIENLYLKPMKQKPNAVFQSQTKRKVGGLKDDGLPGPGAYHDENMNPWNKRTFNIHFTGV